MGEKGNLDLIKLIASWKVYLEFIWMVCSTPVPVVVDLGYWFFHFSFVWQSSVFCTGQLSWSRINSRWMRGQRELIFLGIHPL